MKKFICYPLNDLIELIPALMAFKRVQIVGQIENHNLAEVLEIIDEKHPFYDYELFGIKEDIYIFKLRAI